MSSKKPQTDPSFIEFIIILSLMMSLTALSIDAMLPALPEIGVDLGVQNDNSRQLVISTIFLGIALGQLFFGPLSDKTGRKPAIYIGYALFSAGAILSAVSTNYPVMLAGRLLQGLGISAPRAITLAIVRDRYEGRMMARVMSFTMTVFILVPMIAPTLGQTILLFSSWRSIFLAYVVIAALTMIWFAVRMPETHLPENRKGFSIRSLFDSTLKILKNRQSLGYTVSAGLISGAFIGYLNSSQQIFQEQYHLGELFPLVFAIISLSVGAASFINARLVLRYGMRFLVRWSLNIILLLGLIGIILALAYSGHPPLGFLMAYIMLTFFGVGILFGNQNSLAMEPLGDLAGLGSAIIGSLSTFISMPLGTLIGQAYNDTITPLIIGIILMSGISILIVRWAES